MGSAPPPNSEDKIILIFLLLGLVFYWKPIAYVEAVKNAARVTGPLILQYPLYGGIMGIMTASGLAVVISKAFLTFLLPERCRSGPISRLW